MHFDLVDLRLFVAIAEANSLTRGAERCHISAAAASVRVKNVEDAIGARLLYRSSQGVTLTPPGQTLVQHARQVFARLEHLRSDLQAYARGITGHLRVYASITAIAEFLPPVLGRYLACHPDVNVDLRERSSPDIVRAVGEGQTDLGIVSGPVRSEGLEVLPYRSDRLVLVVSKRHQFSSRPAIAFSEALCCPHVGLHEGTGMHAFLSRQAAVLGKPLQLRIQVGGFEAGSRMVAEDVGVCVMPASAAARHARILPIRAVPLEDAWAVRRLQLCARSFELLPGFARALVQMLVEEEPHRALGGGERLVHESQIALALPR